MGTTLTTRERSRLRDLARQYRALGYDVLVQPTGQHLPSFLHGVRPDMIARAPDDNVVIEVKTRRTLTDDRNLEEIARKLEKKPGWRFEMVLTNPRTDDARFLEFESLSYQELERRINSADILARDRDYQAAVLLLWTAIESVLRRAAVKEGVSTSGLSTPARLIKELRSLGELSSRDYKKLTRALEARNQVVHGFRVRKLRARDYQELRRLATKLLDFYS